MSIDNSPNYWQGVADGQADNEREAKGEQPIGPCPPTPDYPVMYLKGYNAARGGALWGTTLTVACERRAT